MDHLPKTPDPVGLRWDRSEPRLADPSDPPPPPRGAGPAMFQRHRPLRKGGARATNGRVLRGCCGCHALPTQKERGESDGETKGNAILDGNVPVSSLRPTGGFGSYPGWSDRTALQSGPGRERRPPIVLEPRPLIDYATVDRKQPWSFARVCKCLAVLSSHLQKKKNGLVPEAPQQQ